MTIYSLFNFMSNVIDFAEKEVGLTPTKNLFNFSLKRNNLIVKKNMLFAFPILYYYFLIK